MATAITRQALAELIAGGSVVVVEALSADFYADGHLPGAINVPISSPDPLDLIRAAAPRIPVVVYGSRHGGEATELAQRIEEGSACPVMIYAAGKEDWVEAGLAVERSP